MSTPRLQPKIAEDKLEKVAKKIINMRKYITFLLDLTIHFSSDVELLHNLLSFVQEAIN